MTPILIIVGVVAVIVAACMIAGNILYRWTRNTDDTLTETCKRFMWRRKT